MIALGVDIGKVSGIALLDCGASLPTMIDCCAEEHDLAGVLFARFFDKHPIGVVGIETPTQVFEHGRARLSKGARISIERSLLAAAPKIGVVRTVAGLRAPSAAIYEGQAHDVRRAVLGRLPRSDVDGAVKQWALRMIRGWPARSNDHERDAAAVAYWAACWRPR